MYHFTVRLVLINTCKALLQNIPYPLSTNYNVVRNEIETIDNCNGTTFNYRLYNAIVLQ